LKSYELTERGKVAIAVLLGLLVLLVPTVVVLSQLFGFGQSVSDNPPHTVATPPNLIDDMDTSDEPLPEGSGSDPSDSTDQDSHQSGKGDAEDANGEHEPHNDEHGSGDDNSEQGSGDAGQDSDDEDSIQGSNGNGDSGENNDSNVSEPLDSPSDTSPIGPVGINRAEGTMSFRFSPEQQDSIDDDTIAMLGEFILSPRNINNAQIRVEVPSLSDSDRLTLKAAIVDAFASHGISERRLVFSATPTSPSLDSYEIRLSFIRAEIPK